MDMLNIFSQTLITKACWSHCINFFVKWIGNYGWAIIVFTIALKLILLPLDILQRRTTKKNAEFQAKLQPELAKLQEKYPNDREKVNQKTMELSKKYNYNMTGSCLGLLGSLIVTMIIFFTLFSALNSIADSQKCIAFKELDNTYIASYQYTLTNEFEDGYSAGLGLSADEYISKTLNAKYDELKDKYGFLWIQNVWKSDTNTSPYVSLKEYKTYYQKNVDAIENEEEFNNRYNTIVSILEKDNSSWNGYYILIVLAGGITLLVQWLSQKSMKKSTGDNAQMQSTNKVMMIVMPIVMLIFAASSNALFTLYIITNSLMSAFNTKIIDLFMKDKGNNDNNTKNFKKKNVEVVEYSRNYFKG